MEETLSTLFERSGGAPVEVNGRFVQPIFELGINQSYEEFSVHIVRAAEDPVPGLRLKIDEGAIQVGDNDYQDIVLWSDTSPKHQTLSVRSNRGCRLNIWNVWRVDDIMQAWIDNAGIFVTREENLIRLECSDGIGDVDFTSLIVEVTLWS